MLSVTFSLNVILIVTRVRASCGHFGAVWVYILDDNIPLFSSHQNIFTFCVTWVWNVTGSDAWHFWMLIYGNQWMTFSISYFVIRHGNFSFCAHWSSKSILYDDARVESRFLQVLTRRKETPFRMDLLLKVSVCSCLFRESVFFATFLGLYVVMNKPIMDAVASCLSYTLRTFSADLV